LNKASQVAPLLLLLLLAGCPGRTQSTAPDLNAPPPDMPVIKQPHAAMTAHDMSGMTELTRGTGESFDILFITQMIAQHKREVEMGKGVLSKIKRPELKKLAEKITRDQRGEMATLEAWLQAWYAKTPDPKQMEKTLTELKPVTDTFEADSKENAERAYLRAMRTLHGISVEMAAVGAAKAKRPELRNMAAEIEDEGRKEADIFSHLLNKWYSE
jgi:uncharacterized protein (DUF305 family)